MRWLSWVAVVAALASPVEAQDGDAREVPDAKKILSDFSLDYDPRELYPKLAESKELKLVGPLKVAAVHVFPAREPGPYVSPPLRIWSNGWGTSLWRNPVTGWPEM